MNDAKSKIGRRAFYEVQRLCRMQHIEIPEFCIRNNLSQASVYHWAHGAAPSAVNLAMLHNYGCDIYYILTGRE